MPGFNGRGPMGQGPMTGGGRGRCSGYARADQGQGMAWGNPQADGQGRGRGMGPCGGGRARGRGRGMGYGQAAIGPTAQDLQAEAEDLRRRLAQVEARLESQGPGQE